MVRGGSWLFVSARARSAARDFDDPGYRLGLIGFRVCRGSPIEGLPAAPLDTVPLSR